MGPLAKIILFRGLFERHINTLLPKIKSSQAKNLPENEKTGDCHYRVIDCITAKVMLTIKEKRLA